MSTSLLKFSLKTNLVKSLISEIVSNISRYYYAYGRSYAWPDDSVPPAVSESYEYEIETRNDLLLLKQIDSNDIAAVIPRINWVGGYTFDMYDEYSSDYPSYTGATSLENAEFYCLTDDFNVYKCLYNNNNSPSSRRPIGTSTTPFILDDGYMWKYLYTIPLSVRNKFLNSTTMPVSVALSNQFYSKGSIVAYNIDNPGAKYPVTSYKVVGFRIVDGGSAYSSAPTITLANPDQSGGTTATIATFQLTGTLNASTSSNVVTGSGTSFLTDLAINSSIKINGVGYIVNSIASNTSITINTTISVASGSLIFRQGVTISAGQISKIEIFVQGSGYSYPPIVTISGGSPGRVATVEPIMEKIGSTFTRLKVTGDGRLEENPYQVSSIAITNGGSGYSSLQFLFTSPDLPNGVIASANGVIGDVQLAGTLNASTSSNVVTGSGTLFLANLAVNSWIKINSVVYRVITVTSNTSITISATISVSASTAIFKSGTVKSVVLGPLVYSGSFIPGNIYTIISTGNTDFTLIGAANSLPGTQFTATDVGAGNGTASLYSAISGYGYSKPFFSIFQDANASNIVLISATSAASQTGNSFAFNVITQKNEAEIIPLITADTGVIEGIIIDKPGIGYTFATVTVETSIDKTTTSGFIEASILLSFGIGDIESKQSTIELTAVDGAIPVISIVPKIIKRYEVTGVTIVDAGSGYTSTPTVTISAPNESSGVNASIASVTIVGGVITSIKINNAGSGYLNVPTVTIAGGGANRQAILQLVTRTVNTTYDAGGFGYTSTPIVTVTGDGTGCTAIAVLNANRSVEKIEVVTPGINYTTAIATITGGGVTSGSVNQAVAHAIISPKGGHGKDAVSELYAKTVVLHGNLSKEKNQTFTSTNDYRQISIIKNPKQYGKNFNYRGNVASTCITVFGNKSQAGATSIIKDDVLTYTDVISTPNRVYSFRVIEKNVSYSDTDAAFLLSYVDNFIPPNGATLIRSTSGGAAFNISSVSNPDINKYSGEMLTIDNRISFAPSTEQIVVALNSITF